MALLGNIGRAGVGAAAGGAKAIGGAAALGTGAFLRQAASPIPGGTAAMTAGLGIVGAVGSGAMSGFRRGGKGGAGGADGSGAGGGVEVLTQGIQKLIQVNERGFADADIYPYLAPDLKDLSDGGVEVHFWSYYKFWDPQENFYYCVDKTGFKPSPDRSEGTYSRYASLDDELDGFHYYLILSSFL